MDVRLHDFAQTLHGIECIHGVASVAGVKFTRLHLVDEPMPNIKMTGSLP